MPKPLGELVKKGIESLYSDILTPKRFVHWKNSDKNIIKVFDDYVFGEIFWRKSIGRPTTEKLRDAFIITAAIHSKIKVNKDEKVGLKTWTLELCPWWGDGKSDDEYWRVSYRIPNVTPGQHHHEQHIGEDWDDLTWITPKFVKGVPWKVPGGKFGVGDIGVRVFEPAPPVVFMKEAGGPKYISFEVVMRAPLVFDSDGVAKNP
jgi:hypothetical protein